MGTIVMKNKIHLNDKADLHCTKQHTNVYTHVHAEVKRKCIQIACKVEGLKC